MPIRSQNSHNSATETLFRNTNNLRSIQIHNTATGGLLEIEKERSEEWTVYVCGPTVYDVPHIGNARPAIVFGAIVQAMRHVGMKVKYVSNYTDIDDKIINRAEELGVTIQELTDRTIKSYHKSISDLGVLMPDVTPRATDSLPEMITMISRLIDLGHAYESQGHVLFDTTSSDMQFLKHGVASNPDHARIAHVDYKRNQADFVLWKPEWKRVGWDSPWGKGRPGWHIECSAMVKEHLGKTIDIHGGGHDLIFPHHEAECQQSYCANRAPLARLWAHCGMVRHNGRKMSKSDGTFITVDEILDRGLGDALRWSMLSTHYRQPYDFTEHKLLQAQETLKRLWDVQERTKKNEDDNIGSFLDDVIGRAHVSAILRADFNTPQLIADGMANGNRALDVFGFVSPEDKPKKPLSDELVSLMNQRALARFSKDYELSDKLRDQLLAAGVKVYDKPDGSSDWEWA